MSEFWKRKVRKFFAKIDFDSDGVVSKEDFVGMAIQYSKLGKQDKQKAEYLKAQFEDIWELYIKNAEIGDRKTLTADDLIVSLGKQRYDPQLMKPHSFMIRSLHDMLDVNLDGYLQEKEYERLVFQTGVPDQSFTKMAFAAIDVNGDGKLSIDEFVDAFFDFLFSEDEKSPYAYFLGSLDD